MAAQHQHYVPQLLLRGFLSKLGNEADKEQVRVYDLERKESFLTSITNIMGERRFNDWWVDDEILVTIEPSTTQIESRVAPLVEQIRAEKRLELNAGNRATLALLMAFQFIRTKKMRLMPERINQKLIAHVERMGFDPAKVDGLVDWDKESLKLQHVRNQVQNLDTFTKIMEEKIFFVMTAPEGACFYLSDHPVALHSDQKQGPAMWGLGIGVPYIQIYLPISADVMLCAYDPAVLGDLMRGRDAEMDRGKGMALKMLLEGRITIEQMKDRIEKLKEYDAVAPLLEAIRVGGPVACNKEQVAAYNYLQVFHAQRFVVDPLGDFSIVDEVIAHREGTDEREDGRA
jgi:hypothetical protein